MGGDTNNAFADFYDRDLESRKLPSILCFNSDSDGHQHEFKILPTGEMFKKENHMNWDVLEERISVLDPEKAIKDLEDEKKEALKEIDRIKKLMEGFDQAIEEIKRKSGTR